MLCIRYRGPRYWLSHLLEIVFRAPFSRRSQLRGLADGISVQVSLQRAVGGDVAILGHKLLRALHTPDLVEATQGTLVRFLLEISDNAQRGSIAACGSRDLMFVRCRIFLEILKKRQPPAIVPSLKTRDRKPRFARAATTVAPGIFVNADALARHAEIATDVGKALGKP